jgi:hypothetical protein
MWSSSLFLLLEVLKVFPCAVVVCYNGSDGCCVFMGVEEVVVGFKSLLG